MSAIEKAKRLKVSDIVRARNRISAQVDGHSVIIYGDNSYSCDCKWGTFNITEEGQKRLCSHVIALIKAL